MLSLTLKDREGQVDCDHKSACMITATPSTPQGELVCLDLLCLKPLLKAVHLFFFFFFCLPILIFMQ